MIDLDAYPIFLGNKKTLKEISKDNSVPEKIQYMTESKMEVVDFDQVKRCYLNELGLSEENATSVDAIVPFVDHIAFVEFKNGKVNNRNVKDKARDSLLIFSAITEKDITYTRDKLDYIVVYNLEKNPLPNQIKKENVQESLSRVKIADHFLKKSKTEFIRFDLEPYKKLYFREVHTYPKEKFEEIMKRKEIIKE